MQRRACTSKAAARPCLRTGTLAGGMAPLSPDASSNSTAPSFFSLSMRSLVASLGSYDGAKHTTVGSSLLNA